MPRRLARAQAPLRLLMTVMGAGNQIVQLHARGSKQLRLERNPSAWGTNWLSDLPRMPDSHAPDSDTWTNTLAMCAVMKDERVEDVQEWISYYRWLGFDHVFLTDNGSKDWPKMRAKLAHHFSSSFLTLRSEAYERAQLKVYAWCAETQREHYNWLAFFDLDEYLVLRGSTASPDPDQPPDLRAFLEGYKHTAALAVSWIWVGPSGRQTRPDGGGVLHHYTQCVPQPDTHVKSIVNTFFLEGTAVHPHNFHYREGLSAQDELGNAITREWRVAPPCHKSHPDLLAKHCASDAQLDASSRSPHFNECCFDMPGALNKQPSVERIALFHYATKSWEDFAAKMERGSGMSKSAKTTVYYDSLQERQTHEPICKEAAVLWRSCCTATEAKEAKFASERATSVDPELRRFW